MGKTSQKQKEKRLAGRVSLALAAGMFSVVPVAHGANGLPTLDTSAPHTGGTPHINEPVISADGKTMTVTGKHPNNVVDWKDFSVASGNTVAFTDVNNAKANYMNIVTGVATSAIDGTITNNGDIYLINPNGVIFGKGATINVGNLYVSTREASEAMITEFQKGNEDPAHHGSFSSVIDLASGIAKSDVVSLINTGGHVAADKVVVEGRNIRFLNSSAVKNADNTAVHSADTDLVLRANSYDASAGTGYIHVGDASGEYLYTAYTNGSATPRTNPKVLLESERKAAEKNFGVVNYALITNASELQNINSSTASVGNEFSGKGLSGNYMLADNINATGMTKLLGSAKATSTTNSDLASNGKAAFTGHFDGMFFTVDNLKPTQDKDGVSLSTLASIGSSYAGLFAYTDNATIENVGISNANFQTGHAGSIVGYANNTTLRNVWNAGGSGQIGYASTWTQNVGGLIGVANGTTLMNAYNAGSVKGSGLIAALLSSNIYNAYNIGNTLKNSGGIIYGAYYLSSGTCNVKNVFTASKYIASSTGTEIIGPNSAGTSVTNSYVINSSTSYTPFNGAVVDNSNTLTKNTIGLYSNWSISSEGGTDSVWRIYEGESLPLLNSFMKAKGTVAAEYTYNKNGVTTQSVNDTSSKVYSATKVAPTDIVLYGANGAAQQTTDGTAVKNLTGTQFAASARKDVYTGSGTTATKFALLYGGQQGYDLYGNNFTITKRSLKFDNQNTPTFTKVYDGDNTATDALKAALSNATSGTSGFCAADKHYVDDGYLTVSVSGVSATYDDKNVGSGKAVTVSAVDGEEAKVSLAVAAGHEEYQYIVNNYDVTDSNLDDMIGQTYNTGEITARPVLVSLKQTTGIDKTYDGTADVTNENKAEIDGLTTLVGIGNIKFSAIDGEEKSGFVSGEENSLVLSATSQYVDSSGNETKNVAGTTRAVGVAYKDIVATDTDGNAGNYAFYYKVGEDRVAVSDSPLTASGSITPRTLSKDNLVLKDAQGNELGTTEKPITKTYDGTTTKPLEAGTTATYASMAIIDNTTDATAGQGSDHGLLKTDAANIQFASTGTVTFYKSDGTTQTSFATANDGAQRAGFGVSLTVTDDSILTNYQWSDAPNVELATSVDKVGATGTGVINKSDITVALKQSTGIDKVYDGNANVTGSNTTTGLNYVTGNYEVTSGERYTDATTGSKPELGISGTPNYSDENVEYDGTTPTAKSIAYTIALSGAAAGNYNLKTATNTTNTTQTVELTASGTITPKELTVTFGDVTKPYDTTADVTGITPNWDGLVTGDSANDTAISGKYVAKDAQGEYQTASDVGSYLNDGTKAVMYTGIVNALGENAQNYKINGKHYTLSNTEYGKGYITARKISLDQLKSYLDPKGNLTKTYDASADYTHDMVTANNLAASDYLQVDTAAVNTAISEHTLLDGATTDIQTVINDKLTIAEAVYRNADATRAVNASDTPYTNVSMTFNMDGTGKTQDTGDQKYYITVGNYDFEWAESFSDATSGTPESTGRTGTITPKGLTVTVADATKIYDGTQTVKANGVVVDTSSNTFKSWFTFSDTVGNETVTLANGATATYDTKEADADGSTPAKRITYSGLALANGTNGGLASNYKIVDSQGATISEITGVGTINKRNVTISDYGAAAATKPYDGNANVANYALTFAEDTKEGATDKSVLYADGITTNAGVISSDLSGTYLPTGSQTQGQGKDVLRDSTNRATILEKDVEYTGTALTNLYGGNYNVTLANGGTYNSTTGKLTVTGGGKITPKGIELKGSEVHAADADKVYDGKTTLENAASSYLTFDSADVNAHLDELTITGKYNSKNAGARTVTYTISMDANNYDLSGNIYDVVTGTATKTGSGTISKKTIYGVVGATAEVQKEKVSKVYDGDMTVEGGDETAAKALLRTNLAEDGTGAVAITDEDGDLDKVSILTTGVTLAYKDANVATSDANDKVTYSGLDLDGDDKDNYQLASTTISGYGTITPKSIAFAITVADGAYKKDYDEKTGLDGKLGSVDTTNSATLTGTVTAWWNGARATGDTTEFGDAFETDAGGNLVGYYGVWNPTTKTFTENSNVWADKANNKKTSDVYYGLALKGDAAQNYVLASTGGTTGATINVNNTTIQDTVYFQNAMQGKGEIKPLAISMEKVKNEWGTFEKVYDGSTSVEGYLVSGAATPTKEQQLTIYYERDNDPGYTAGDVKIPYSVNAANYEDANAGNGKNIAYTGFSFNDSDLDNFVINATDLANAYADGEDATKTTGNIARRLLNVAADDDNDHTKTYDGNEHSLLTYSKNGEGNYVEHPLAYTVAAQDTQNDDGTGRVGDDNVFVTYVANFNPTGTWDDAKDVNIADQTTGAYSYKNVTYTFTLSGNDAANYTIVADKRTPGDDGTTTTAMQQDVSAIKPREVYVDFAKDGQGHSYGENLDKTYDGKSTPLLATGMSVNDILTLVANGNDTGIVAGEENSVYLKTGTTANYVDANGNVSADADAKLGITTTRDVYFQNFALDGAGANNYVVKVKNGADKKSVTNPTTTAKTLIGKGKINQRVVDIALKDDGSGTPITKVYNRSEKVEDYTDASDVGHKYASDNVKILPATGVNDGLVDGDNLGLIVDSAIYFDKTAAGSDTPSNPEIYATYNAGEGLGVSYKLKWDNQNYTLVKTRLYGVNGEIKQRTLVQQNSPAIVKTYDGTTALGDTSSITKELFGNDVLRGDEETLLTIDRSASQYARANVYAATDTAADIAAAGTYGTAQDVTVVYTLNDAGSGKNYQLAGTVERGDTYNGVGTGRINRAQVTMSPTEVSYYPSQLATATYTGQAAGFVNGDNRPTVTYGRDGNTSTLVGKYTLLGYVNGKRVPVNGETFADGFENYYFTTKKNSALTILAEPVKPDVPVVPDIPTVLPDMGNKPVTKVVTESVISDTKFTPDEYSYNRMSKDSDTTHVNRVSSATLQYSEKGVNIEGEDTKSGLASLADIQGRGSVVNLNGALIQTSAPAEQPEKVAETAALPISETDTTEDATLLPLPENEENDVSSIGLEYADNTGGSQSVLEILTNASSKAENKGTSIVIDTQDEDEEDAEIEKTRRAIFADRSNIGIETLGNAVNLNQMIG